MLIEERQCNISHYCGILCKKSYIARTTLKMLIKHSDVQPMTHVKKTVLSSLEKQPQGNQSNKAQFQSQ